MKEISRLLAICVLLILTTVYVNAKPDCGNWDTVGEKCYKIVPHQHVSYEIAQEECREHDKNAILPVIHTPEEQEELFNYFRMTKHLNCWLGAQYRDGSFHWEDNSTFDYANWQTGSPKNRDGYCALMRLDIGQWVDESCHSEGQVVCQRPKTIPLSDLIQMIIDVDIKRQNDTNILNQKIEYLQWEIDLLMNITAKLNETTGAVPVGFIYFHWFDQKAPQEIWPKFTWQDVSTKYDGLFVRVVGNGSADFGVVQEADAPRLTQVITGDSYSVLKTKELFDTFIDLPQGGWSTGIPVGGYDGVPIYASFNYSNAPVRPRNTALKVWKRIA